MTRKMVSLFLALVMLLSMVSISAVAEEKTQVLVWTNARHDYDFFVDLINRYNAENDKNIIISILRIPLPIIQSVLIRIINRQPMERRLATRNTPTVRHW